MQVEERRLKSMEKRLGSLESDFEKTAEAATGLFGFLNFGAPAKPASLSLQKQQPAAAKGAPSSSASPSKAPPPLADPSMWKRVADKMVQIESMLNNQEMAVEAQSFTVKKLRKQVRDDGVDGMDGVRWGGGTAYVSSRCPAPRS